MHTITKYAILLLAIGTLSACSKRYSPNEIDIVTYPKVQIPKTTTLPIPDKTAKPLGYVSSRETVLQFLNNKEQSDSNILVQFHIRPVPQSIRNKIDGLKNTKVVVVPTAENDRIYRLQRNNHPLTRGKTPSFNYHKQSGIDTVFE